MTHHDTHRHRHPEPGDRPDGADSQLHRRRGQPGRVGAVGRRRQGRQRRLLSGRRSGCPSRSPACSAAATSSPSWSCSRARASPTASCACRAGPGSTSRSSTPSSTRSPTSTSPVSRRGRGPGRSGDRGRRGAVPPTRTGSCCPAACRRACRRASTTTSSRRLKARGKTSSSTPAAAPLAEAIGSGPDMIKPNIDELGELVGRPLDELRRDRRGRTDLHRRRRRSGGGLHGGGRRPLRGAGCRRAGDPARHRGQEHRGGRRRHGGRHRAPAPCGAWTWRAAPGSPPASHSAPSARSDPTSRPRTSSHPLPRASKSTSPATTDLIGEQDGKTHRSHLLPHGHRP